MVEITPHHVDIINNQREGKGKRTGDNFSVKMEVFFLPLLFTEPLLEPPPETHEAPWSRWP
jgi:hypothetical protein